MPVTKTKETVQGLVTHSLPDTKFLVEIGSNKKINAYLSGRMYKNRIRVIPGDRVTVELSPDGRLGRIVRRL